MLASEKQQELFSWMISAKEDPWHYCMLYQKVHKVIVDTTCNGVISSLPLEFPLILKLAHCLEMLLGNANLL